MNNYKFLNIFLYLSLFMVIVVMVRLPSFDVPLSQDESFYGYKAHQISEGNVMYKDVINPIRNPLGVYIYTFILKVFGMNVKGVRLFTLIWVMLTVLSVYTVGNLLFENKMYALTSTLFYSVFNAGVITEGLSSNLETFICLPVLISIYLFLKYENNRRVWILFLSGFFAGLAYNIKHPGGTIMLVYVVFIFWENCNNDWKNKVARIGLVIFGFIFINIMFSIFFWNRNAFYDYLNQSLFIGVKYSTGMGIVTYLATFIKKILVVFNEMFIIFIFGLVGVICIVSKEKYRRKEIFTIFFLIVSFLGVGMSGNFYHHYFIQIIPALCFLSSYGFYAIFEENIVSGYNLNKKFALILLTGGIVLFFSSSYPYYKNWLYYKTGSITQKAYTQFFRDGDLALSIQIGEYIKENTDENDYIYVYQYEPIIYLVSGRKSPDKTIFGFWVSVLDIDGEETLIRNIINKNTKYLIFGRDSEMFTRINSIPSVNYKRKKEFGSYVIYEKV